MKDEHLRLCPESLDKATHIEQAKGVNFPEPANRYSLTPECVAAVEIMADSSGPALSSWRQKQVQALGKIASETASLTHELYQLHHDVPRSVKTLRRTINVVFIAVLIEAIGWADTNLCRELTRGFRTAGDLRDQDSGVFRPSGDTSEMIGAHWKRVPLSEAPAGSEAPHPDLARSLAEGTMAFSYDKLREWGLDSNDKALLHPAFVVVDSKHGARQAFRSVSFQERWSDFTSQEASLSWLKECEELLTSKAHRAVARAEEGQHEEIDLLNAVSAKTAEEMASGLVGAGMSTEQLKSTYLDPDGTFHVHVAPRFGVWQGIKMLVNAFGAEEPVLDANGNHIWKLRCIDDFKVNGLNGVTWLSEHLVMPNFEFPARIGAEFSRLLEEQPAPEKKRQRESGPGLVLGLDDLFAAYRRIPNADSRRYGIVGVYDLEAGEVRWHEVLGLPFGLASAPIIFNRVPALMCVFARAWCGVAVDQFVDDYITVDRSDAPIAVAGRSNQHLGVWASSAQYALSRIHDFAGLALAVDKRKPAAPVNVLLGVEGDLSAFKDFRRVRFRPTKRRCQAVLSALLECKRRQRMHPREAAQLLGRLTFILSSSYGSVGRAATQPLVDRAANRAEGRGAHCKDKYRWTESMSHMLRFFQALFQELPDLQFDFKSHKKRKVVIYTDASFDSSRNGLGFIVFDQETGEQFVCDARCPPDLMARWEAVAHEPWPMQGAAAQVGPRTHINALELLAITAAVWTVGPTMLQDREVLFFCDNTAAMSAAVHGYARSPNLAPLSNALHLALASLRCTTWFEWVPSDANCADIPSRPQGQAEREFYRAQGLMCWPGGMRFPSLSDLLEPSLHDVCRAQ